MRSVKYFFKRDASYVICRYIDVAKRSHEAAVINQDGSFALKPFKFDNSSDGFVKLMDSLKTVSESLLDLT
ncbi:MAG: IS110 family transposase [Clostridiales bacterium]|nr:IS110 family transposase [Clostridiales bacterium]